jgi:hypothetical protein
MNYQEKVAFLLKNVNEVVILSNQVFTASENDINRSHTGAAAISEPDAGKPLTYSIRSIKKHKRCFRYQCFNKSFGDG